MIAVNLDGLVTNESNDLTEWTGKFSNFTKAIGINRASDKYGRMTRRNYCNLGKQIIAPNKTFSFIIRALRDSLEVYLNSKLIFNHLLTSSEHKISFIKTIRVYGSARTTSLTKLTDDDLFSRIQQEGCGQYQNGAEPNVGVPNFCPRRTPRQDQSADCRIIGGSNAKPGIFPWQVSIRRKPEYSSTDNPHLCGGTLVGSCWVVTAAHCFLSTSSSALKRLVVRVGDFYNREGFTYSADPRYENSQDIELMAVYIHDEFQSREAALNDVALIRLKTCVKTDGTFVRAACLPRRASQFLTGEECVVTGWGASNYTQYVNQYPPCLQKAKVIIQQYRTCHTAYGDDYDPHVMMCASGECTDTCQGDSGGPLMCFDGEKTVLWGITSWGVKCGFSAKPGVYTRLSRYIRWLYMVMELQPKINKHPVCPKPRF
ncbi:unnamed protein product [Clavelina lepadiformis]|uniref:Peptidase S1 domain-containing protein n=1 Tax=Clavelina lepadiformis TaxID=159417 RepID=A0ABP0FFY5_CLALP